MSTKDGRLRVLHVVSHLHQGGLERVVSNLALKTDPTQFDVQVLCLSELGTLAEEIRESIQVSLLGRQSRFSMFYPARFVRFLRESRPDVLHCHSGVWLKSVRAGRLDGALRIIYTEHGRRSPDPRAVRALDSIACRDTDLVVAVSSQLATQLEQDVVQGRVPISLIPNGVDTGIFCPQAHTVSVVRKRLGIPTDAFVVGSLGRLVPIKTLQVLLDSFGKLLRQLPSLSARLVIGGDGPEGPMLRALAKRLGLSDQVIFLGWRDDTHMIYPAMDVFSLSSVSEGTSISLLEAMSSGVCPVVTAVGGNPSVLGPDLSECLVPPNEPQQLANAWAALATDSARRSTLASLARDRVLDKYSLRAMVRAYEETYLKMRRSVRDGVAFEIGEPNEHY